MSKAFVNASHVLQLGGKLVLKKGGCQHCYYYDN
jgi:hypothetical protein